MPSSQGEKVEVVLFGPGYGESVAVNLCGKWLIVDSCVFRGTKMPAPLQYLINQGFDPAKDVHWVIASHWHDDHVRGIGELFEACSSAKFGCPNVLRSQEFFALVGHSRQQMQVKTSGVDELSRVLFELERRKKMGSDGQPKWIGEGRNIWTGDIRSRDGVLPIEVVAASPSDEAFQKGILSMSRLLPSVNPGDSNLLPKRRFPAPEANHTAIVLSIKVGHANLLLGSDLETTNSPQDGWDQVHDALRLKPKADLLKIPHHGSITGHHDAVWSDLVDLDAVAIMTPFSRGRVNLPTISDIERILRFNRDAYISYPPRQLEVAYSDKVVNELVQGSTRSPLYAQSAPGGIVRLSKDPSRPGEQWQVQLSGGAVSLGSLGDSRSGRKLRLVS